MAPRKRRVTQPSVSTGITDVNWDMVAPEFAQAATAPQPQVTEPFAPQPVATPSTAPAQSVTSAPIPSMEVGSNTGGGPANDIGGETADQIITRILASVGLGDLAKDVIDQWKLGTIPPNTDVNQLGFMLRDTDAYKKRFPGNKALRDANKSEYTVTEYLQLEKEYKNAIQGSGIPSGFYDSTDYIGQFIKNDVSVAEVKRRVNEGYRAVAEADPEVLNQLRTFYPNVGDGELAAFFLAPEEARPVIVARAQAAQVGAQAVKQATMQLTTAEAESLVRQGVDTMEEAAGVFGAIGAAQGLFEGQMLGEEAVSREEQLLYGTGNVQAQQRIATRRRRRQAAFEAGGGFAPAQGGIAGLGTANR